MEFKKQSIENIISIIKQQIESKYELIANIRKEFTNYKNNDTITIKSYLFFDIIDEFEITITHSLQAIQTLNTEIMNLKEKSHNDNNNYKSAVIPKVNQNLFTQNKKQFDYPLLNSYKHSEIEQFITSRKEDENISVNINNKKKIYIEDRKARNIITNNANKTSNDIDDEIKQIKEDLMCNKENDDVKINIHINKDEEENEHGRIPIRQNIQKMIKESKKNKVVYNQNDLHKEDPHRVNIEQEEKIKELLTNIGKVETYRIYFSKKYGNGNYDDFLNKLNNNQIPREVLEDELSIVADLMTKQLSDDMFNKKKVLNNINKPQITRHSSKREIVEHQKYNGNVYIEPVKFGNYLRSNNNGDKQTKKKRNMCFSQEKIFK